MECTLTTKTIVVLAIMIFLSAYISFKIISSDIRRKEVDSFSGTGHNEKFKIKRHYPNLDDSLLHLDWFMQISDIHISKYKDKARGPDLEGFLQQYVKVVQPQVILVTGDLTDAKEKDGHGSEQYLEEWQHYQRIIKNSGVTNSTVWLDIRGNHDAFDVPSISSEKNLYRQYSEQGKKHSLSYHYIHRARSGSTFSFIGVDACPDPGPKRPFNFFGIMDEERMNSVEALKEESAGSDMRIWFGHYPTGTIISPQPGIRNIISSGPVYMCGHLHTLGEKVIHMYTRHYTGNLELELGDWMDNRVFRIFAVDHGLFSFTDNRLGAWPIILITNPKNSMFHMPVHENIQLIKDSTHIRMLIFSPSPVQYVEVSIDDKVIGEGVHKEGPLYVLPWTPELYSTGLHTISVYAKDANGKSRTVSQSFSIDGTRASFGYLQTFLLVADLLLAVKLLFIGGALAAICPLVILRVARVNVHVIPGNTLSWCITNKLRHLVRKLYLLSSHDKLFYQLLAFNIYTALGPGFIGEILNGHIGAMFPYGVYVKGLFLPGSRTYVYGVTQYFFFNIPLMVYLAHCRDRAISEHKQPRSPIPMLNWLINHGVFVLIELIHLYFSITMCYIAYGLVAMLVCPTQTWAVGFALYWRHIAMKSPQQYATNGHSGDSLIN